MDENMSFAFKNLDQTQKIVLGCVIGGILLITAFCITFSAMSQTTDPFVGEWALATEETLENKPSQKFSLWHILSSGGFLTNTLQISENHAGNMILKVGILEMIPKEVLKNLPIVNWISKIETINSYMKNLSMEDKLFYVEMVRPAQLIENSSDHMELTLDSDIGAKILMYNSQILYKKKTPIPLKMHKMESILSQNPIIDSFMS